MQEYGIGLESEGYVLDSTGHVIHQIDSQPSIQYVLGKLAKQKPKLLRHVSPELAAFIIEVKSDVFSDSDQAIQQILEIRSQIDELLQPHGGKLIFQPVIDTPFEFSPSTTDPNSRAHKLIQEWSSHPESAQNLRASSICSLQINDSRPFKNFHPENPPKNPLEIARQIHNLFSGEFDFLASQNKHHPDYYGQTRLDYYFDLVTRVKGRGIQIYGNFNSPKSAVIPPYFADISAMKRWMAAHSSTKDFDQAECKNEHALTVKIKRDPCWVSETRIFDAVNSEAEMKRLAAVNQQLLSSINL